MVGNNFLVTGGAGYIGSHTVLQLLRGGYNIVAIDNLGNSSLVSIELVKELAGDHRENLTFHQVDLRDKPALEKLFSESKFDAVIHCPGQKAVGECEAEPLLYYTNNLIGTTTLLEVMAAHGCKKLVVSSSAALSGSTEESPLSSSAALSGSTEESPLSGMSFYARTQLCIEKICQDVQLCDPEWRIIMLRYFNPVGAQSDYTTKDGLDLRDDVHFVYLANGHIDALQKLDDTKIGCEVYDLGFGEGTTAGMKIPQVSPSGSQQTYASAVIKSTPPPPKSYALRKSAPPPPPPPRRPQPPPAKIIDKQKQIEAEKAMQERALSYKTSTEAYEDAVTDRKHYRYRGLKNTQQKQKQKNKDNKDNKDPEPKAEAMASKEVLDYDSVIFCDRSDINFVSSGQRKSKAGQRNRKATASASSLSSSASASVVKTLSSSASVSSLSSSASASVVKTLSSSASVSSLSSSASVASSRLDDLMLKQLEAFVIAVKDGLGPSQSQFQASGSSSPSLKINYPTETKESLKEGSDGSVTVPMASSQVDRKMKGKAVEEYSSTETTTITVSIMLADSKSGIPIEIPFRSNQTIRDIRNAIDELTPNSNRDYELQSGDGECRDLNKTVDKICIDGFAKLYQTFL